MTNTTQDSAQSIGVRAPHRCRTFNKVDSDPQPVSVRGMSRLKVKKNFDDFFISRGLNPKGREW